MWPPLYPSFNLLALHPCVLPESRRALRPSHFLSFPFLSQKKKKILHLIFNLFSNITNKVTRSHIVPSAFQLSPHSTLPFSPSNTQNPPFSWHRAILPTLGSFRVSDSTPATYQSIYKKHKQRTDLPSSQEFLWTKFPHLICFWWVWKIFLEGYTSWEKVAVTKGLWSHYIYLDLIYFWTLYNSNNA